LRVSPHFAVLQNIVPEHLDYYDSFAEYVAAKSAITKWQTAEDYLIYCPEFETSRELAGHSNATKLLFKIKEASEDKAIVEYTEGVMSYEDESIISGNELPLLGEHNLYNVAPAIIVAKKLGIATTEIAAALRSFKPLPHRLQP
ncbi:MAG: Mur ligase family protein, partial [bacterium]|nr:Mur ligase family protein [bacterium]